jgi:hypothetical protein
MSFLSPSIKRIVAVLLVIAGGFWLRRYGFGHHIPAFYVKFGYSALWAAMIYFLVALLLRSRSQKQILVIAALACALLEASKLSHTPALEIFRITEAGGWLPGRVFSPWNFCALAAGLALAWAIDSLLSRVGPASKSRTRRR